MEPMTIPCKFLLKIIVIILTLRPFERWILEDGKFTKELSDAKINVFVWYPESFVVPSDFCNNAI